MNLKELKNSLDSMTDNDFVFSKAFTTAHSWRGSYDEVAFEFQHNVTLKECKHQVDRAFSETFRGWKGGEYQYSELTPCNLDLIGCYTEWAPHNFNSLIKEMIFEYNSSKENT